MEKIRIYEDNKESVKTLLTALEEKDVNKMYYMILNNILVHKSTEYDDYNKSYIKAHKLLTLDLPRKGGTIVGFPKDIQMLYFVPEKGFNGIPNEIFKLQKLVRINNLDCTIQGNDFLVEGYKVASFSINKLNPEDAILCITIICDYDIDVEVIKRVCKKKMIKEPKGLKDFNIKYIDLKRLLGVE